MVHSRLSVAAAEDHLTTPPVGVEVPREVAPLVVANLVLRLELRVRIRRKGAPAEVSRIQTTTVSAAAAGAGEPGKLVRMAVVGLGEMAGTDDRSTSPVPPRTTRVAAVRAGQARVPDPSADLVGAVMAKPFGQPRRCHPPEQTDSAAGAAEPAAPWLVASGRGEARASSLFDTGRISDVAMRRHRTTPEAVHPTARRMKVLQGSDAQQPNHPWLKLH